MRPYEWLPHPPPGVVALAVFFVVILVAYFVYRRLGAIAWLVPVTAVVAAVLAVVDLPEALVEVGLNGRTVPWTRALLIAVLAVLVGKLLLLHRHATRQRWKSTSADLPKLLPSQKQALRDLTELIMDQHRAGVGQVVPLEGRPGDGKSFLLLRLKQQFDNASVKGAKGAKAGDKRVMAVIVDVWQQQTEADLQAAILEEVFCHPSYMERYRWLRVPVSFLVARQLAMLSRLRSTLQLRLVGGAQTGVELDLELPTLRWQRHFEQATARMAGTARTVVILDELDRAVPAVTQSALTLARRSVDVPGVTVVLAYVRAQVRYKAFNPLLPALPDLASSMEAILYEYHHIGRAGGSGEDSTDSILRSWQLLHDIPAAKAAGFLADNGAERGRASAVPRDQAGELTPQLWLRLGVFARADRVLREQLQERFEEKYLGPPAHVLKGLTSADVAYMATQFDSSQRFLARLTATGDGTVPPGTEAFTDAVEAGIDSWRREVRDNGWDLPAPPIRVLEGYLHRAMERAAAARTGRDPALTPEDVAALVVGAYYIAAVIYGFGGDGNGRRS